MTARTAATMAFAAARDFLIERRDDYEVAARDFRWPRLEHFNWALDWFDGLAAEGDRTGLWLVDDAGGEERLGFAELSLRSNRVANFLRTRGLRRGDRVLVMLPNVVPLWEVMLAIIKLGAVMIPATTLLSRGDLADRLRRGGVRHAVVDAAHTAKFAGLHGGWSPICTGAGPGECEGWARLEDAASAPADFAPDGVTRGDDPLLLYFTSGTTATPKLVEHTHTSYPAGHLSTMYWLGLQPGDLHLNISSPGWAKHAWSSFFAPWNAGATILVYNYERFSASALLDVLVRCGVTTMCAPPTVWRALIQEPLPSYAVGLRDLVSAGEPLNPEVIERVRSAWGITIRDGYGQTETTAQVGNTPGQQVRPGSMGRPLPGYRVVLLDAGGRPADEGEICLDLGERPLGLMTGYRDDAGRTAEVMRGGHYHTGDVARRDADGHITYVGRTDDVFKSSDYRISPFELESVLIEHEAVAEAAVVPSPDPLRLAVPKAFVVLAAGHTAGRETALSILRFSRERLGAYKRVRRLEFSELPKTISGKIRRVDLRAQEEVARAGTRGEGEYWEEDFPELRGER